MIPLHQALHIAASGTLDAMRNRAMWRDIGTGIVAKMVLVVRCAILVTFPVSVPLIACMIMLDEHRRNRAGTTTARYRGRNKENHE